MLHRGAPALILLVAVTAAVTAEQPGDASGGPSGGLQAQGPTGDRWTNSIGIDFVSIPSGAFTMGSTALDAELHERPAHSVTISRTFYVATTEVTQLQWEAVMGGNPSRFRGDGLPVEQVSWFDAQDFIRVLRGGSWLVHANRVRSWFRDVLLPDERRDDVGFRVVAGAGAP